MYSLPCLLKRTDYITVTYIPQESLYCGEPFLNRIFLTACLWQTTYGQTSKGPGATVVKDPPGPLQSVLSSAGQRQRGPMKATQVNLKMGKEVISIFFLTF